MLGTPYFDNVNALIFVALLDQGFFGTASAVCPTTIPYLHLIFCKRSIKEANQSFEPAFLQVLNNFKVHTRTFGMVPISFPTAYFQICGAFSCRSSTTSR